MRKAYYNFQKKQKQKQNGGKPFKMLCENEEKVPSILQFIEQFSNVAGYKINAQKSVAFLYTNNETEEGEITESIPFTIAPKTIHYIGINLSRDVKYL